jgi:pyrimidine 5'-nucleotidase
MTLNTLLLDLDDTLYPASCGLWAAIRARINLYIVERLGLSAGEAATLRQDLFKRFGTTLRGLQSMYQVNEEDYLKFVHDVPLADYIRPDPHLRQVLQAIPLRKVIFTNADSAHARRVVQARGLEGCFERIIDLHTFNPFCKPMVEAFQICLQEVGAAPQACVLVDDSLSNLVTAKKLGIRTV